MLEIHVSLWLPSNANGRRLPRADVKAAERYVVGRFVDAFGGATVRGAVGYWQSPRDGLVAERIRTVESFTDRTDVDVAELAESVAIQVAARLGQECVAFTVNHRMYFATAGESA